jgi:hypothetical protein
MISLITVRFKLFVSEDTFASIKLLHRHHGCVDT